MREASAKGKCHWRVCVCKRQEASARLQDIASYGRSGWFVPSSTDHGAKRQDVETHSIKSRRQVGQGDWAVVI